MAICTKLFKDFSDLLKITKTKKQQMMTSRENLRETIRKYFADNKPEFQPKFFIQGSYKMGTTIRTKEDECDLDDGVYFSPYPNVTAETLQKWVLNSVEGVTNATPMHKNKCIRVKYASGYHIDLPIYYKDDFNDNEEHPKLAIKDSGYQESDPKELVDWFCSVKNENNQLVRIIRYLKAWSDNVQDKMPNGLTLTILTAENILFDESDEMALVNTLKNIKRSLTLTFKCIVPATPYDDLLADYSEVRKQNFFTRLDAFIKDAEQALEEKNQLTASRLWRKHLGTRFPEGVNENVDEKLSTLRAISKDILSGSATISSAGIISVGNGVKHLAHRNFGEDVCKD